MQFDALRCELLERLTKLHKLSMPQPEAWMFLLSLGNMRVLWQRTLGEVVDPRYCGP